jgi:hypothetical protein
MVALARALRGVCGGAPNPACVCRVVARVFSISVVVCVRDESRMSHFEGKLVRETEYT